MKKKIHIAEDARQIKGRLGEWLRRRQGVDVGIAKRRERGNSVCVCGGEQGRVSCHPTGP